MNVLLLNGSAKEEGATARALNEIEKVLKEENIETETMLVGNKVVSGCIACESCRKTGKCVFDDIVNQIAVKFEKADGIIVGTPTYYASASGSIIAILDRLFYSTHFNKMMKVGATIISSSRSGGTTAFDEINKYYLMSNMPIVSSNYWNEIHGNTIQDADLDWEGLQTMRNLGKNMAFMLKAINLAKEKYGLPENDTGAYTDIIML